MHELCNELCTAAATDQQAEDHGNYMRAYSLAVEQLFVLNSPGARALYVGLPHDDQLYAVSDEAESLHIINHLCLLLALALTP